MKWLSVCKNFHVRFVPKRPVKASPINCGKWIYFLFSSSLYHANCKIFVLKISVLEVTVSWLVMASFSFM